MSVIDDIKLIHLPRLDDFAKWGEAVARILGYKERQFLEAIMTILESRMRRLLKMSCPKIPIQLSRRINEIRTSLLDGTRIEVTIERLTTPRNIIDEKDSSRTHTYKRDTTRDNQTPTKASARGI